jgi:hypothetical protein
MNARVRKARKHAQLSIRKKISRLRAIVFINCLIIFAKIKRDPCALKRWGQAFEREVGFTCDEQSAKWRRFLRGALVAPYLRAALCKRFFGCALVLISPLWEVLARLEGAALVLDRLDSGNMDHSILTQVRHVRCKLDTLAQSIRFNDQPLAERSLRAFKPCTAGFWPNLGFLLAILASRSSDAETLRTWLSRHFTLIFLLTCLAPGLQGTTRFLFQIVDRLIRRDILCPVHAWPTSVQRFKRSLKNLSKLMRKLRRHHVRMTEDDALSVIHAFFTDPDNEVALSSVLGAHSAGTRFDVGAPAVDLMFRQCRKKMYSGKWEIYYFEGMELDPKLLELERYFKAS